MKLSDAYAPEELPTRPDNPATVARRCKHCGRVYGDHAVSRPGSGIATRQIRAACGGLRRNYQPEAHADDDGKR